MSLILDALRKMEQDRNSRRGAAPNIRPEVLRYRGAVRPTRTRPWLPIALGLFLLVVAVGGGYLLKQGRPASGTAAPAPVESAAPAAQGSPAQQAAPAALPQPQQTAPLDAPAAGPASPPMAPAVVSPAPVRETVAPRLDGTVVPARQPGQSVRPQGEPSRAVPPRPAAEAVQAPQGAGGEITISGIAWQEERNLRRAVINGQLVGEGAEIAGARVVEIKEDRVRLSRGGQLFDAPFASGLSR